MQDYIVLMHADASDEGGSAAWDAYLKSLQEKGALRGGSAIGPGRCFRRSGAVPSTSDNLSGFIRIEARDLDHARELLEGNPVFEAGGTVEVRELPRTG